MDVMTRDRLLSMSNQILHLILLPTEACNFRCVYCYEDFRYKRMTPEVVRGVKSLITRRVPSLRLLSLSWFGGEPMLARDIVEEVMGHVQALRKEHAVAIRSDATTNGSLLTPELFGRLVDLGVNEYQITFDGPKDQHDRYRVLHGGKGTFDVIWGNLLEMRSCPDRFDITIRVHVNRENAASIPRFIDQYAESFREDERFRLFIRGLARLGGPQDESLPVFEIEEGRRVVEELRDLADRRGLRQSRFRPQEEICYAAKANSFVIRSNGRINKCTVALEHPANQVGSIREDGTLALDPDRVKPWLRGLFSGEQEALECPMKGLAEPSRGPSTIALRVAS